MAKIPSKKGKAKRYYDVLTTTFTFFEATLNTFWEDQSHCMIRTFGLILQFLMPGESGRTMIILLTHIKSKVPSSTTMDVVEEPGIIWL